MSVGVEQEVLRAWGAQKYSIDIEQIGSVSFDHECDYGYSEDTPGEGPYTSIEVKSRTGQYLRVDDEYDANELIVEVCRFAAGYLRPKITSEEDACS